MQPTTDWSGSAQQRRTDPGGCPSPTEAFAFVIPRGTRAFVRYARGSNRWKPFTTTREFTGAPVFQRGDMIIFEHEGWAIRVARWQLKLRPVRHETLPRFQTPVRAPIVPSDAVSSAEVA